MKKIFAGISVLALIAVAFPVQGADTAGVTATVTVENISVTVSDGSVAYGTLAVNTAQGTAINDSDSLDDTQTATNNGNITENFNIRGSDSGTWTLAGSAGANQYVHEFCRGDTGDCDGSPTNTALTTSYQALDTSVAKDDTQDFDLRITTPTSSDFTEHNVNVTVQAVAS